MKGPGQQNSFAKRAKRMKYPLQMDNKDYGKKTKCVARNINFINSKTGACYGTKTIMTKEGDEKLTFVDYLLTEDSSDDITVLPGKVIDELKGMIRKGAADLAQKWANALELTHKAYHVCNVRRPTPDQKGAWKQYEDLIAYGVRQLSANRGIDGKWRAADVLFREAVEQKEQHIGNRRFFVEIQGMDAVEADARTMDEVIEHLTNKLRRHGAKLRIEHRTPQGAILTAWINDVRREKITIKEVS